MASRFEWPDDGEERAARPFAPDLHDVRHLWLKGVLLTIWASASFGVCFFARDLRFSVGDWPIGFWMASQGAVFVFLAVVVVYAIAMSHFEREDERKESAATSQAPINADDGGAGTAKPHATEGRTTGRGRSRERRLG